MSLLGTFPLNLNNASFTIDANGNVTITGTAVTALTHFSTLGVSPAAAVDTINYSGTDYQWTQAERLAYFLANDGSQDLLTSTPLSSLPSDLVLFGASGGAPVVVPKALLVGGATPSAPVNTTLPTISGTAQVGQSLTSSQGVWTNTPTSYAYQWKRSGTAISGATGSTYTPVSADIGTPLTVTVTASNGGGPTPATSTATANVIAAASGAPANTVAPTISGTAQAGQTLTASTGTWTNSPTGYTYQWYRAGTAISGATATTYTLVSGDVGNTITVTVSATNATSTVSASSAATATVIAAGGSGNPGLTLASPTFATGTNAIFGSGASLSGGTGTASLNLAVNPAIGGGNLDQAIGSLVVLVKIPATTFSAPGRFINLTSTNGTATTEIGWYISNNVNAGYYLDGFHDTTTAIADGTVKQLQIDFKADYNGNYLNFLVGGTSLGGPSGGNTYLHSGAGGSTLHIDMAQLPAGSLLDVVWVSNDQTLRSTLSAEPTRDGNTNLLCLFNAQDGTGS